MQSSSSIIREDETKVHGRRVARLAFKNTQFYSYSLKLKLQNISYRLVYRWKGNIKMDLRNEAEVASGLKWPRTGSVGGVL